MRSAARAAAHGYAIDVVLWLLAATAIALTWTLRPRPTNVPVAAAVVAVLVVAAVLATVRQWQMRRLCGRAAEEARNAQAERDAETAQLRASLAKDVNAIIVETVAAAQGVVRSAYPDDILLRLNTADDALHALLDRIAGHGRSGDDPEGRGRAVGQGGSGGRDGSGESKPSEPAAH